MVSFGCDEPVSKWVETLTLAARAAGWPEETIVTHDTDLAAYKESLTLVGPQSTASFEIDREKLLVTGGFAIHLPPYALRRIPNDMRVSRAPGREVVTVADGGEWNTLEDMVYESATSIDTKPWPENVRVLSLFEREKGHRRFTLEVDTSSGAIVHDTVDVISTDDAHHLTIPHFYGG